MSLNAKDLTLTTVATAPSPATSGTSLTVASGTGAWYPTTFPFYVTSWASTVNPNMSNAEIMKVTAISTDTFTVVRAQLGTTAQSIAVGWNIGQGIYVEDLNDTFVDLTTNQTVAGTKTFSNNMVINAGLSVMNGNQIDVYDADGTDYLIFYHANGATGFAQIESSNKLSLVSGGNQPVVVGGPQSPQLYVQYAGGSYNSITFGNDDTNGYVSTTSGELQLSATTNVVITSPLDINDKINIATGTNASAGTVTLSAGTATVDTTAVTASSIIMLTTQSPGTIADLGEHYISAKSAGVSFTISSANALDASTVGWLIIN